jgi:predicted RNase H-like HicB family nuclease
MLTEYIEAALARARYELIDDPAAPYYGEIPDLPGIWASAESLDACRAELKEVVEGWLLLSVKRSLPIPPLGDVEIAEIDAEAA